MLVLDGVFDYAGERLTFHPAGRVTREEVAAVVAVVVRRIGRLLTRRGLTAASEERNAPDMWAEEAPVLAGIAAAAAVGGRIALGPQRGATVARYGSPPEEVVPVKLGPCHAALDGFDLHAGVVVPAGARERLEQVCRYTLRPPLAVSTACWRRARRGGRPSSSWRARRGPARRWSRRPATQSAVGERMAISGPS